MMSRYRLWFVGLACLLISFAVPLATINALATPQPEIRVVRHGDTLSAMLIAGNKRMLVVHSTDRRDTRSAMGYLVRPWEPYPVTVVSAAEDAVAVGLWEATRHADVGQVLVAGLPGSEPLWSTLERDAEDRNLELTYLRDPVRVHLGEMAVDVHPSGESIGAYVRIAVDDVVVAIHLGSNVGDLPAHVTIDAAGVTPKVSSLTVVSGESASDSPDNVLLVGRNEAIKLHLEDETIRIDGGRYYPPLADD